MSRKLYLIAYDVCDPKRLTKVHKTLKEYASGMVYNDALRD